ncbi:hypothetical protein SAMN05192544_102849 [Paraburkholderia hospita]|jgi:hypothetical protein|nr:hypothetical protein SAMN05192544_102849 [Paraburkholderia hospita]
MYQGVTTTVMVQFVVIPGLFMRLAIFSGGVHITELCQCGERASLETLIYPTRRSSLT